MFMCNFDGNVLFTELGSDTMRTCLKVIETYLLLGPQEFLQVRTLPLVPVSQHRCQCMGLCAFLFPSIGKKPALIPFPSYPATALDCCHHHPLHSPLLRLSFVSQSHQTLFPHSPISSVLYQNPILRNVIMTHIVLPSQHSSFSTLPCIHYHYPTLNTSSIHPFFIVPLYNAYKSNEYK